MAEPTVDEGWTPVPGWEGLYLASRVGRIYSVRSKIIMKQTPDDAGYLRVKFSRHNKAVTLRVHQIIALTFHGPCPPGQQVRHWDGNNQHNAVSNLLYGTKSDDIKDQIRIGTHKETRKTCCPRCQGPYKVHLKGVTKGKRYCPACGNANRRARLARQRVAVS
jgi:HNH endonuclease/NUMOD4 motif